MSGKPESSLDSREQTRQRRHAIRDRLARGVYEREKARDPTDRSRQSSWEDLNEGRRATRLNYADELLTTLVGALGLTWSMLESTGKCALWARETGAHSRLEAAEEAEELADILSALIPRTVKGK